MEEQARKSLAYSELCLTDSSVESSADQNAGRNLDNAGCTVEVPDRIRNSISSLTKYFLCYHVSKDLNILWPCPKALCQAEFNHGELDCLAEEILSQTKVQDKVWLSSGCPELV